MKKTILFLTAAALIFFACKKEEKKLAAPPPKTLARVDNTFITEKDFDEKIAEADPVYKKFLETDLGKENLLSIMVREALVREDAINMGVPADPKYQKVLDDMQKAYEIQRAQIQEDTLIKVWLETLREKNIISVTDEEVAAYHKRYSYEITVRIMTIAKASDADAVLRELKATSSGKREQRFKDLGRMYSVDKNGVLSGGDVITFIPGEFLPEIENAAANTSRDTVQGFFKTSRGFTIIYKKSEERISLKNAKERVRKILENKKLDEYLKGLSDKYKVEVYKKYED